MAITFPKANIRTHRSNSSHPYGFPWNHVAQYEPHFTNLANKYGLDPVDLACMSVIESDATHYGTSGAVIERYDADPRAPSVGLMQIKVKYHQWLAPDADGYTPKGNIEL